MTKISKAVALLACVFLASCASKPVFISDIESERITAANSTKMERIVSGNKSKDIALGIAILVGIDETAESYVALAPAASTSSLSIQHIGHSLIRTLDLKQAKELLHVVNFAIDNYDAKVGKLESINASFQSALKSNDIEIERIELGVRTWDHFTFSFVNIGRGSEAKMDFHRLDIMPKILKKEKLELLKTLLNKAIEKVETD